MDFNHQTVALSHIRDEDSTYRITTGYDMPGLDTSIRAIGLINPPILQPQREGLIVVSGFRRIAACRALNWEKIPTRLAPSHATFLDCVLLAIADNATQRVLNIVETARCLGLLACAVETKDGPTPLQLIDSIGISVNTQLAKMLETINRMGEPLQEGLIDGTIAMPVALRLHDLDDAKTVETLCRIFREMHLSLNRQREMLDWTIGIAMREGISLSAVLSSDPLLAWINDSQLDRGQKVKFIRDYLKRRRYPEISRFEEQYQHHLKKLNLAKGIRLEPPPNFEGQTFGLHLSFKDEKDLALLARQLGQLTYDQTFMALLRLVR